MTLSYVQNEIIEKYRTSSVGQWLSKEGFVCYGAQKTSNRVYIKSEEDGFKFIINVDEYGVLNLVSSHIRSRDLEKILLNIRTQFLYKSTIDLLEINKKTEKEQIRKIIERIPLGISLENSLKKITKYIKGYTPFIVTSEWILNLPFVKKAISVFGAKFINSIININRKEIVIGNLEGSSLIYSRLVYSRLAKDKVLFGKKIKLALESTILRFFLIDSGKFRMRKTYDISPLFSTNVQEYLKDMEIVHGRNSRNIIPLLFPLPTVNISPEKAADKLRPILLFHQFYLDLLDKN